MFLKILISSLLQANKLVIRLKMDLFYLLQQNMCLCFDQAAYALPEVLGR